MKNLHHAVNISVVFFMEVVTLSAYVFLQKAVNWYPFNLEFLGKGSDFERKLNAQTLEHSLTI